MKSLQFVGLIVLLSITTVVGGAQGVAIGEVEESYCTSLDCTTNCTSKVRTQGHCYAGDTGSYTVKCTLQGLALETFADSTKCEGSPTVTYADINKCHVDFGRHGSGFSTVYRCPSFTQKVCTNSKCTEGCESSEYLENVCLQLKSGGSAIANCTNQGELVMNEYPLSSSCTGTSVPNPLPLNSCIQDSDGNYMELLCTGGLKVARQGAPKSFRNSFESMAKKIAKSFTPL